jgi:hypothetical protein
VKRKYHMRIFAIGIICAALVLPGCETVQTFLRGAGQAAKVETPAAGKKAIDDPSPGGLATTIADFLIKVIEGGIKAVEENPVESAAGGAALLASGEYLRRKRKRRKAASKVMLTEKTSGQ